MKSKTLRLVAVVLLACMMLTVLASCSSKKTTTTTEKPVDPAKTYTYRSYSTSLGNNWNPHTWETNADSGILGYLSSPFVDMSIKDSVTGEYQWVYEMATAVTDVTATHQGDLTKYPVDLPYAYDEDGEVIKDEDGNPTFVDPSTITEGYVFEIQLNPNAKWENGEVINADDYIYSMKQLLNPKMRNYRSNLYWSGESAVAGGLEMYNAEAPIYNVVVSYVDDVPVMNVDPATTEVYLHLTSEDMTMASYSFSFMLDYKVDADLYKKLNDTANAYGYIKVTPENQEDIYTICDQYMMAFGASIYDEDGNLIPGMVEEFLFYNTGTFGDPYDYAGVGCYKVDDYTIVYVNDCYIDFNYFMTSLTSTWLVYEDLYEAGKDTTGELVTTNYGTSPETTMSYGVYKLASLEEDKQIVFVQNENWYGFEKQEDGSLISYTNFLVDGKKVQQYQATSIIIDVMTDAAAELAFMKGQLTDWAPAASELPKYTTSSQIYQAPQTYTMSFFFNTDVDDLKEMDNSKGNTNSVVMSNINFRKAFSLAVDRAEWVTATPGYTPAYSLMNSLYHYDIYNDPTSSYRASDEAMQAICNLYNVQYGEGTPYATLKDAYDSITGYNLTEAKALMKTACEELVKAGLYTAGQPIYIKIGYAKGSLTDDDQKQVTLMTKYLNAALEGSGFGTLTFEACGSINDRYAAVPAGEYAIGYGAWGGAAFYPFRNFQVYMDPVAYKINEAACWDPTTHEITLTVNGVEDTMTAQDWSNSMISGGKYANADNKTKLSITAQLEEYYLKLYYRIPLASDASCYLVSYQVKEYTKDYNVMYGFGGLRLMSFVLDDAAWAAYVASQPDGTLNYK